MTWYRPMLRALRAHIEEKHLDHLNVSPRYLIQTAFTAVKQQPML